MKMQKYFFTTIILFITAILSGCSDDSLLSNDIGSTLEEDGDYKISTFTLSNEIMGADETVESVTINLKSDDGTALQYMAEVEVEKQLLKCHMRIPKTEYIPDGEYELTALLSDGTKLGGSFKVLFKDEMLHAVQEEQIEYTKLNGEGTEEDPYIIGSKDDFYALINNLRRDSIAHGSGRYFKQTATFNAPSQSELYDGRSYYNYAFAGIYDGGGFTIENLYYVGAQDASKDCGIGLFSELFDGAEIKNLNIYDFTIMNTASDCGALAGRASGNIKVSNVNVKGTIVEGGSRCGGLVGSLEGNLTVNGYDMNLTISGTGDVGGILGYASGTSAVKIRSVTTNDHHFSISGGDNVGGLIGRMDGEFHISRIVLEHTVSTEDDDLRIISGTGKYLGGIIGYAENISSASSLDSIKVKCPIGGASQYIGGLVGYAKANAPVTLNYCQMTSVISGGTDTGGLIGYCNLSGSNTLQFIGEDNLTKVVADDTAATISGEVNVGGLFGSLYGSAEFKSKVRVAINVSSTGSNCGGAFGLVENATLDLSNLIFDSNTMKVSGGGECTGGIIGYIGDSTVSGPSSNAFNFGGSTSNIVVPKYSQFTPMFTGSVNGKNKNGGIIGKMLNVTAIQLSAQCTVTGNGMYTGGIVGHSIGSSQLTQCSFGGGTVTGHSDATGGIAGYLADTAALLDCINYAPVNGTSATGGVIGYIDYSNQTPGVNWCVNTGAVNASGTSTGGVVGYMTGSSGYMTVRRCANYGKVSGAGGNKDHSAIGGIVGFCTGKMIRVWNCANHGDVYSSGTQHGVGGIAGSLGEDPNGVYASQNLEVGYCCNRGELSCGNRDTHIGGILGYQEEGASDSDDHDSWLHDCINYGNVTSAQDSDNGGILGCADHYSFIEKSVNFGSINGGADNATIGTHKSSCIFYHENLYYLKGSGKDWCADGSVDDSTKGYQSSYSEFDFTNVWEMVNGYPALRDCPFQSVYFSE